MRPATPSRTPGKCDFLVLRKRPYAETSLLLSGISPERGKIDFIARGALRHGRRQSTPIDLFRHFRVQYSASASGLHTWREADPISDFSPLARSTEAFRTACWLARFALDNSSPDNPCPAFFQALLNSFSRLRELGIKRSRPGATELTGQRAAATVGALLIFLEENGLLPEKNDPAAIRNSALIMESASQPNRLPELTPESWRQAFRQTVACLRQGHCTIPRSQPD